MHKRGACGSVAVAAVGAIAAILFAPPAAARDDTERDRLLQPERVMDVIGVRPGMVVGEAGAGRGYFTLKLARRVGPKGRVYANDIDRRALEALRTASAEAGLENVQTVAGSIEDPLFPVGGLEMVMMVYAIHDFARPAVFLANLKKYLGPNAAVVVLDQNPEVTGSSHFMTRERLVSVFGEGGYALAREERLLEKDLLLVFRPQ